MDKQGYPGGTPDEDRERMRLWWSEEMKTCGLAGAPTVQYASAREEASWSANKRLFESLVMRRAETTNAHMYHAAIPGAPWPLDAVVMTTDQGMITDVVFRATLKRPVGEVRLKKSLGMFSEKIEIEGAGAEQLKARKDLVKKFKNGLNRRYQPPLRGFHASTKTLELAEASVSVKPEAGGSEAVIHTTVREESAFVGKKYFLGLDTALDIFKGIETLA